MACLRLGSDSAKLNDTVELVQCAFWRELTDAYPEGVGRDSDPVAASEIDEMIAKAVRTWVKNNILLRFDMVDGITLYRFNGKWVDNIDSECEDLAFGSLDNVSVPVDSCGDPLCGTLVRQSATAVPVPEMTAAALVDLNLAELTDF